MSKQPSNDGNPIPTGDMGVSGTEADALQDAFETRDDLVDYLTDGGSVTDYRGIGSTTSRRVLDWFKDTRPGAHRERRENHEGICTEFYEIDERADDGAYLFGYICPRCGGENDLRGDPRGFRNRTFACVECRWVALLEAESIDKFVEEVDPKIERELATDGGEAIDEAAESETTPISDQAIGTEAGQVAKRFESWDDASEWRENGHARNIYGMPRLTEAGEYAE